MTALKEFRDTAAALPDLLNYGFIIDDGVYLNKDGSVSAGFYYTAPDINSSTPTERNVLSAKMNKMLAQLGTGWSIHIDAVRLPIKDYPDRIECHFKETVNALIDEERRSIFIGDGNFYETTFSIILTYEPPSKNKGRVAELMFEDGTSTKTELGDKILAYFKSKIDEFQSLASNIIQIKRMRSYSSLDEYDQEHTRDQFLEFTNGAISGEHHPMNVPQLNSYLDSYLGNYQFFGGVTPRVNDKFIGVVAISGFPQESIPNMLNQLSNLETQYRWNTRFIFRDQHEALSDLNKYRRKWLQKVKGWKEQILGLPSTKVDEHAQLMVNEIDSAIAETNSGILAYGYYTSNVVLMDSDREALDNNLKEVVRIINALGFSARIEDINAIEAWLGTLPSHTVQNVRRPLISTFNLSHMMPLSSIWAGDKYNQSDKFPPGSPALMYTLAHGSTPFRLNLHVSDIGHTLIFGPTGAGKSTLLATLASQFRKYQSNRIFAFDKGNSLLPLALASSASHYEIGGEDHRLSFAPLANIETDYDQAWCENWIESMLQLQGVEVTPEHRKAIHTAMTLQRNTESKSLTDFVSNLQDHTLTDALSHYTLAGPMGHLLDGEEDTLSLNDFTVFEIEELMNLGDKNLVPVLLYLFHTIEKMLDGTPTALILDEAWIMLGHPVFKEKIREWLKVLRKANCFVVLATQSLSDAGKSGILDVLQESCPTKIFLANPYAFNKGTEHNLGPYDYYVQFGLNDAQISIIANATPKREYYYLSPLGKRLFNLALGEVALSFVGASGKEDIKEIKKLYEEDRENWMFNWMDHRGVNYSQYLENII